MKYLFCSENGPPPVAADLNGQRIPTSGHKRPRLLFGLWKRLTVIGMAAACLLLFSIAAHAFPTDQCTGPRFGSNLGCTANDVQITNIRIIGDVTSCIGGTPQVLDLEVTVNFGAPTRYDVGVFISNDGKDPQLTIASGGATTCSVAVLPNSSPFMNIDPNGGLDTCGDGNQAGVGGGTGTGVLFMDDVTVRCQALAGSGGNLYIPFVVSWDQQASPPGANCTSNANPVPGTSSKCNAPTIAQGTVSVVVLPTITKTHVGDAFVKTGESVNYTVTITNTTGATLNNAVFKDPAVTNISVTGVNCSGTTGGATCPAPASVTIANMQGAGITIPSMPVNSSVTFTINTTLAGNPPDTLINTASVTVAGQTASASDTLTIVGDIAISPSSSSKYGTANTLMVYNYTLYNFSGSTDTISLTALSNQGWTVQIRNALDSAAISSINLSNGASENFIVKVQVPAGAAIGTVDITSITAISGNNPSSTATATAVTNVSSALTVIPDANGSAGNGNTLYYEHRVQNNTASSQNVSLLTAFSGPSCGGWTAGVYDSDKVTPLPSVSLAPFGGYKDFFVKVIVPVGAATNTTCAVTVTASISGASASAIDTTTVRGLILYSNPGETIQNLIYPHGNTVYARVFGLTNGTQYKFLWYDSSPTPQLKRTSINTNGVGTTALDTYTIPLTGVPSGTWLVEVRRASDNALFASSNFYVGPDHVSASYTGTNPGLGANATIDLALHDRSSPVHLVPKDPSGNVVTGMTGNPQSTKDPLKITVTVSGSATIVATTLTGAVISGQTVTGNLSDTTGTATITITDSVRETVTVTATSYNEALYGSALTPTRDESATVNFVNKLTRIIFWKDIY